MLLDINFRTFEGVDSGHTVEILIAISSIILMTGTFLSQPIAIAVLFTMVFISLMLFIGADVILWLLSYAVFPLVVLFYAVIIKAILIIRFSVMRKWRRIPVVIHEVKVTKSLIIDSLIEIIKSKPLGQLYLKTMVQDFCSPNTTGTANISIITIVFISSNIVYRIYDLSTILPHAAFWVLNFATGYFIIDTVFLNLLWRKSDSLLRIYLDIQNESNAAKELPAN